MTTDPGDRAPTLLTPEQLDILEGFVAHHLKVAHQADDDMQHVYQEVSRVLAANFEVKEELLFQETREYYTAMAGLSLGVFAFQNVCEQGSLSRRDSSLAARGALDRLLPPGSRYLDQLTHIPEQVGYFDQASAFLRDSLQKFGIDLEQDPALGTVVRAGFEIGIEQAHRPYGALPGIESASESILTGFALLSPEKFGYDEPAGN